MDSLTLDRLAQSNPWLFGGPPVAEAAVARLPSPWIERRQVDPQQFAIADRAHLVVGPRRAGKSSLAWSFLRGLRRPLYVNAEEPAFRLWCRSPVGFLADLRELGDPPDALFLEEAQWLEDAGLFAKGVVDARPGFPVLITGSSSFHLLARTRETLAGRATRDLLLPFSLGEVAPATHQAPAATRVSRKQAWERLVRVGGYPDAWLADRPGEVLGELIQAFVLRDASDLFQVERLDAYQRLLRLAAGQVGNLVNVSELAGICGVSAGTVSRYLSLMEEAHILRLVPSFAGGRRREITSARKVFFLDNGLRNALLGRLDTPGVSDPDWGGLLENLVFTELCKSLPWTWTIRYWRTNSGAEVDFVVDAPGRVLAIEVKATALSRPRLSRSSRSFLEAYAPSAIWVVNLDLDHREEVGGQPVDWVPLWTLPERLARWRGEA